MIRFQFLRSDTNSVGKNIELPPVVAPIGYLDIDLFLTTSIKSVLEPITYQRGQAYLLNGITSNKPDPFDFLLSKRTRVVPGHR